MNPTYMNLVLIGIGMVAGYILANRLNKPNKPQQPKTIEVINND